MRPTAIAFLDVAGLVQKGFKLINSAGLLAGNTGFSPWVRASVSSAMVTNHGLVVPIVREPIPARYWSDTLEKHQQQTELPGNGSEKRGLALCRRYDGEVFAERSGC